MPTRPCWRLGDSACCSLKIRQQGSWALPQARIALTVGSSDQDVERITQLPLVVGGSLRGESPPETALDPCHTVRVRAALFVGNGAWVALKVNVESRTTLGLVTLRRTG